MNDPQQLLGKQVDAYRFDRFLASGGMADVYLATDVGLNRRVAIKVMLPHLVGDPDFVQRFKREAQTAASLEHPNIVQIYSIGNMPNGAPYIAMQFIDGGSLRDTLRRLAGEEKLLPVVRALGVVRAMADALQFAHSAGIVHRDLKPANVLVRQDGRPVLVDLGIAAVKSMPKLTQTGTIMGTPEYMSPEQASGKPLDGRSDLYSLGVILFELVSGTVPFKAPEPMAILHKQIYEPPPNIAELRPDLNRQTHNLIRRLLQKDAANRYQSAQQLVADLEAAMIAEGASSQEATVATWSLPQDASDSLISRGGLVHGNAGLDPTIAVPTPSGFVPPPPPKRGVPSWIYAVGGLFVLTVIAALLLPRLFSDDPPPTTQPVAEETQGIVVVVVTDTPSPTEPATETPEVTPTMPATDVPPSPTNAPDPTDTPEQPTVPPPTMTPWVGPEQTVIGQSAAARPIEMVRIGVGETAVLFIGGLHAGYAPGTVSLAERAINYFSSRPDLVPREVTLYIIPNASPDSPISPGNLPGRLNANGVDLNRNWDCRWSPNPTFRNNTIPNGGGTAPFSEPETQALRDVIETLSPEAIVFWEARAAEGLSSPGACDGRTQFSGGLATVYGVAAGYPIADFENLTNTTLNGDGTNWLDGSGYPAIAVLLPDYDDVDWENNLAGMTAVLEDAADQ